MPLQNSSALILDWTLPRDLTYLSEAGYEANGDSLYICAADVNGARYPGKYSAGLNACSIGLNGGEYLANTFALLTDNTEIPR